MQVVTDPDVVHGKKIRVKCKQVGMGAIDMVAIWWLHIAVAHRFSTEAFVLGVHSLILAIAR